MIELCGFIVLKELVRKGEELQDCYGVSKMAGHPVHLRRSHLQDRYLTRSQSSNAPGMALCAAALPVRMMTVTKISVINI